MLARNDLEVKLVITKDGRHFLNSRGGDHGTCPAELYNPQDWKDFRKEVERGMVTELNDEDDWATWSKLGDPVLHINVSKSCCLFLCLLYYFRAHLETLGRCHP